VKLESSIY